MVRSRRRGFTIMELLIVMLVIGILVAMLFPALSGVLESSRATNCKNNLNQLGVALIAANDRMSSSLYFIKTETDDQDSTTSIRKVMSASKFDKDLDLSSLKVGTEGIDESGTPYSFFARILPNIGQDAMESQFDDDVGPFDVGEVDTNDEWGGNLGLAARIIPLLQCPSFKGDSYSTADAYSSLEQAPALTQYKAVGGSTLDVMLSRTECVRPEGQGGVIHPWKEAAVMNLSDAEQTAILFETKEPEFAAWIDGVYISIPGIIPDPNGSGGSGASAGMPGLNVGPTGVDGETIEPYLAKVEDGSGGDDSSGSTIGDQEMTWGPSSEHPGTVHHLMGGRVVRSVSDEVDTKPYRAILTRNSRDNFSIGDMFNRN